MLWCVRCGKWYTPSGRLVRRSAAFRGEFVEPEDTICDDCITPLDMQNQQLTQDEAYE